MMTPPPPNHRDIATLRALLLAHRNCAPIRARPNPTMERLEKAGYVTREHGEWWLTEAGNHACSPKAPNQN